MRTTILESKFQHYLIEKLKDELPGVIILKNDSEYIQGFPDLLILYNENWAALETKPHKNASIQPNQDFWIENLSRMSFASFIYPENEKEILDELYKTLRARRSTRFSVG